MYGMDDLQCHILFNPTALRKAKIAYNFVLSECSRVNSVSVLSGQLKGDNERLCGMKPHSWFERFP